MKQPAHLFTQTITTLFLWLPFYVACGQEPNKDRSQNQPRKRFIDKVEVFAGPNLSFNYGNKFIENYSDPVFQNRRLTKFGYTLGIGVYHPVRPWLDINARLLWEEKGTKSEFVTTATKSGSNLVQTIHPNHTYSYLTIILAPRVYFSPAKKYWISLGGYYSKIRKANVNTLWEWKNDYETGSNEAVFEGSEAFEIHPTGGVSGYSLAEGITGLKQEDFGIVFSLGRNVDFKDQHTISFGLTTMLGLPNINNKEIMLYASPERNNSITLIIGYIFKRKNKLNY